MMRLEYLEEGTRKDWRQHTYAYYEFNGHYKLWIFYLLDKFKTGPSLRNSVFLVTSAEYMNKLKHLCRAISINLTEKDNSV
jgi:hypothetical protein